MNKHVTWSLLFFSFFYLFFSLFILEGLNNQVPDTFFSFFAFGILSLVYFAVAATIPHVIAFSIAHEIENKFFKVILALVGVSVSIVMIGNLSNAIGHHWPFTRATQGMLLIKKQDWLGPTFAYLFYLLVMIPTTITTHLRLGKNTEKNAKKIRTYSLLGILIGTLVLAVKTFLR